MERGWGEVVLADINQLLEELLQQIYSQQGTDGGLVEEIVKYYAGKLWAGVVNGYGNDVDGVDYESTDYNMLNALKENVWQFSSAKNYAQLRELSDALLDEEGNLRSFEAFRDIARIINDKFMKQWLRTEYDLAVAGGQMAGKWVHITANRDTLPYLQFDAVMDGRTTEICGRLNGIIRRVDDPIWGIIYPPNHFNCRSNVRQLATGVVTPDSKFSIPDEIPEMFRVNLGQRGLIFPPDHPYFIGLPESILNQVKP